MSCMIDLLNSTCQIIFKRPIRPIDETLTGTTTPSQSGLGSNGNEGVLHTPQIIKTGASPSDVV